MNHNNRNLADIARGAAIASYRKCLDYCRTSSWRNAVFFLREESIKGDEVYQVKEKFIINLK